VTEIGVDDAQNGQIFNHGADCGQDAEKGCGNRDGASFSHQEAAHQHKKRGIAAEEGEAGVLLDAHHFTVRAGSIAQDRVDVGNIAHDLHGYDGI